MHIRKQTIDNFGAAELVQMAKQTLDELGIPYEEKPGGFSEPFTLDPAIFSEPETVDGNAGTR